jgi:hypothetical protein
LQFNTDADAGAYITTHAHQYANIPSYVNLYADLDTVY